MCHIRMSLRSFGYFQSAMQPGETVLDIGAFLGTYAIMAARWTGPLGRVLAFEPSPASFQILKRHLLMNNLCAPRVEARCAAVGARVGRHPLKQFELEPYRNQIVADDADGSTVMVDIVTVDSVCARWTRVPDWIRLDVQGLEFDVLEGAREVIHAGRGRLKIIAEMHPQLWPECGIQPREVDERLAALRLQARALTPNDSLFGARLPHDSRAAMTGTTRAVAEGANRFRHPGIVERLADSFARLPLGPSIRRQLKRIYRVALTIQTGGRGLVRELPGGEVIRVLPRYDYITWNPDEYRAFREVVRPGMVLSMLAQMSAHTPPCSVDGLGRPVGCSRSSRQRIPSKDLRNTCNSMTFPRR